MFRFFLTALLICFFPLRGGASSKTNLITLNDSGLVFYISSSDNTVETVEDFLKNNAIHLENNDAIFPNPDVEISNGMTISIYRAKNLAILDGIKKMEIKTLGLTVNDALLENKIKLNEYDILEPTRLAAIPSETKIKIIRVAIEEKTIPEDIPFEKIVKEDENLSWKTVKIEQKGEKGTQEIRYKIISHNGKEISRKILEKKTVKTPVAEITVRGTYMKLKKANTGFGTWYTQPKNMIYSYPKENGMTAASPWIPFGTYVKVTNKENGKSVVVRINDRGPFGKNRIIDLNTPAFAKIASLGAGVIDVKVEEILN